jgi:tetratricopeptide (TPR) repeat protein
MKGSNACPECGSENTTGPVEESCRCTDCGYRWGGESSNAEKTNSIAEALQKFGLRQELASELSWRRGGCMVAAGLVFAEAVIHRRDWAAAAVFVFLGILWLVSGHVAVAWPHARFLLVDGLAFSSYGIYLFAMIQLGYSSSTTWNWVILGVIAWGAIDRLRDYRKLAHVAGTKAGANLALLWVFLAAGLIPADWFITTKPNKHLQRGNIHLDNKEFDQAIAEYNQVLAIAPDAQAAWFNRALARSRAGDLAGAVADYGEAIAIDPKDSRAWLQRGYCLLKLGQNAVAAANFEEAFRLDPKLKDKFGASVETLLKEGKPNP